MFIDYRTLNSRTLPSQYTTPRTDDVLDCLAGSRSSLRGVEMTSTPRKIGRVGLSCRKQVVFSLGSLEWLSPNSHGQRQ